MTRWCGYAVILLALVCAGVTRHAPRSQLAAQTELTESTLPAGGSLSKRRGQQPTSPRAANKHSFVAILPATIDLVVPRVAVVERDAVVGQRSERVAIVAAARGPPV